jgi:RNA-directed DNA polymerase
VPTPLSEAEGHTEGDAIGKPPEDPAQSETLSMRGNSLHGKREIPQVPTGLVPRGRSGKAIGRTPGMDAWGKSDDCVVPGKPPNKGEHLSPAEAVERRRSTNGNTVSEAASRTQRRTDASTARHRVRGVACRTTAITRGRSRMR